jgi:hypothetical protein
MSATARWRIVATISVVAACSNDPPSSAKHADAGPHSGGSAATSPDADGATGPAIVHTYAPNYIALWNEILHPTCGTLFCHGGTGLFLDLHTKEVGYASLVGAPATGPECAPLGLERVNPGHPDRSLLYRKVTDAPCGKKMPLLYNYSGQLPAPELEQIKRWIEIGAPYDAPPDASMDAQGDGAGGARDAASDAARGAHSSSRDGSLDAKGD